MVHVDARGDNPPGPPIFTEPFCQLATLDLPDLHLDSARFGLLQLG